VIGLHWSPGIPNT